MTREHDPTSEPPSGADDSAPADEVDFAVKERVGYGRLPRETRFKPGQSGNPRGRPKGSKSLDQVLRAALNRRVPDPRRGGRHTVRMLELIVGALVLGAARRDPRMLRLLLALIERYAPSDAPKVESEEVRAADREILDEYIASLTALGGAKAKP